MRYEGWLLFAAHRSQKNLVREFAVKSERRTSRTKDKIIALGVEFDGCGAGGVDNRCVQISRGRRETGGEILKCPQSQLHDQ